MPDKADDRVQVFSLAGDHQRNITGTFRRPLRLLHYDGRLYLTEQIYSLDDACGRRIFVLTPDGQTLQIYRLADQTRYILTIGIFGKRLIVCTAADPVGKDPEILTLRGI